MNTEIQTVRLKRCPFCNSHDLEVGIEGACCRVRCKDCGATGPDGIGDENDGEVKSAVDLWNGDGHRFGYTSMVVEGHFGNRNDLKEIEL